MPSIDATEVEPFRSGTAAVRPRAEFTPACPKAFADARVSEALVEMLVLKFLMVRGQATGRDVADQVRLPFPIISEMLRRLKQENLVAYKATALNDYVCELTGTGQERAQRCYEQSSYHGAAPVAFSDYLASIEAQSLKRQRPTAAAFFSALQDLILRPEVLSQLGQAVCSGRAMLVFGEPGNGKTSIAERVCATFGTHIWIPRAVQIDGDLVRVFDPTMHEELPLAPGQPEQRLVDQRWVRIRRPTIICGGELTLENLELTPVPGVGILEAPLQLKSNCGTLVVDDFGRQQVSPKQLLNRWIVPLERQYDFLNFPSGKKVRVPFDQLTVFSTNLKPGDLVDEAFMRRIPYKVFVADPSEADFRELVRRNAQQLELRNGDEAAEYLVQTVYRAKGGAPARAFRCCHPRDLLRQVKDYCAFRGQPAVITKDALDIAIRSYFAGDRA